MTLSADEYKRERFTDWHTHHAEDIPSSSIFLVNLMEMFSIERISVFGGFGSQFGLNIDIFISLFFGVPDWKPESAPETASFAVA